MSLFEKLQAKTRETLDAEIARGEAFLAANALRPEVSQTPSGLQYEVLVQGTGPTPSSAMAQVTTHYTGSTTDGKVFDSSVQRGQPLSFGLHQVIKGWTEGLQLMPTGSKYKFYIPYQLGYGERGAGASIPGGAALIFEVELIETN
jgi:FKBP-type peptidyl-prolyl cis-trans isomerase